MLSFKEFSKQIDENKLQKFMDVMGKNPMKTLGTTIGTTIGAASALRHGGDPVARGMTGGAAGFYLGSLGDRVVDAFRKAKYPKTKTQKTDE
jgi:hypothetical protein